MSRACVVLLCCASAFALAACGEDAPPPPPAPTPASFELPLPPPEPPVPPEEQARGIYVMDAGDQRASLTLEADGGFRFLSWRAGQARRLAQGTWSLVGAKLTLVYTHLDGEPMSGGPQTVVNAWGGTTVQLQGGGLDRPVVLTKRTMIRYR